MMQAWLRCGLRFVLIMLTMACGHPATDRCRAGEAIKLAVLDFEDTSPDAKFPKCNRALQSFLTTDLAQCRDIVVIERAMLDEVKKELNLADTGLLDPKQAVALGKQLQADAVLTGSIWVAADQIRLDARLVHTESGTVILGENIEGRADKFSSLEKQLATQLLDALGLKLSAFEKASLGRTHTENFRAANMFGMALAAQDAGDAFAARTYAASAAAEDPEFTAAQTIAKSVDALLATLRDDRILRQIMLLHEFEDHVLHASLTDGRFGPDEFTTICKQGKPRLALFQWLVHIQGAVTFEEHVTAFDDAHPGVRTWPYRSLFRNPNSREDEGVVGDVYLELGAAEPVLFWCDVALSDEEYAPRRPLSDAEINPDPLTRPARGLGLDYFYQYMPDIYFRRMRAEVSLDGDYAAGLASARELDRLCRPWLREDWVVAQLEQLRTVMGDPRKFSQAKTEARAASLRWKVLEQELLFSHYVMQSRRFSRDASPTTKPSIADERKRFAYVHRAESSHMDATFGERRAFQDIDWLVREAAGKDFTAWRVGPILHDGQLPTGWIVHVAGCPESIRLANGTSDLDADYPRRPRTMDDADLCLEDHVIPCQACRPCRWIEAERLSKKLRKRVPFLIKAIGDPAAHEEQRDWHEEELLALLRALGDSPADGLGPALRILCEHECRSDRHDRRLQALALQCVGKTIAEDDVEWLVRLYTETTPFDCRANIAAALASLGLPEVAKTLETWRATEPYYFVRHSLRASLARSLDNQWMTRRAAALRELEADSAGNAVATLSELLDEVARSSTLGRVQRPILSQLHIDIADIGMESGRPAEELEQHYRQAVSLRPEETPGAASALNSLAYNLALQRRNLNEAEEAARKALDILRKLSRDDDSPDDTAILDTLALILFEQGKLEEAKKLVSECTTRPTGQSLEIYDHLGDILWAMNDRDGATAAWRKGLTVVTNSSLDQRRAKTVQEKLSR